MNSLGIQQLPAQQEQQTDVFGLLDQQYKQETQNLNSRFSQVQEETLREVRYKLKTLSDKYQQERSYIEGLKIPADQKRQKLLQLNNKYELAAITTKSKVKPDMDGISKQQQQTLGQLQQAYQQKQRDLKLVQQMVDEKIIQDPYAAKQKQYAMMGINLPISAFRPPKELTMEEIAEERVNIQGKIMELERMAETATGEERSAILLRIAELNKEDVELMGVMLPEYKKAAEKSHKLTNVGLQMQAGRKPGTLAEGVWQKKQKQLKVDTTQFRGLAPIFKSKQKEEKTIEPKYQRNKKTGQIRVSYDGGKTWQTIG